MEPFIEVPSGDFMISPFQVNSPADYVLKKDYPNCCNYHSSLYQNVKDWYEKFPNCCAQHIAVSQKWWFRKANYSGLPEKIMSCVAYVQHHITIHANDPEWYKDITDYIEYIMHSFGTPSIGNDRFLNLLEEGIDLIRLDDDKQLPLSKSKPIIEYIKAQSGPAKGTPTDLNALVSTYQKWLKAFPFDLFPFNRIKDHFEGQLPIFNGNLEYNPYLGMHKGKAHTPSSMIDWVCRLTTQILDTVSSTKLIQEGRIKDAAAHSLDIIGQKHKIKQASLLNDYTKGEKKYITVLKTWLKNEKSYFETVTPILNRVRTDDKTITINKMNVKIAQELKQIGATLKSLGFGWFLHTQDFENIMLEYDLDEFWHAALSDVNDSDTLYIGNTVVHEDAFFHAAGILFTDKKPHFFKFLTVTILGLIEWASTEKDFSKLVSYTTQLGFPDPDIESIKKAIESKTGRNIPSEKSTSSKPDLIFIGHGKGLLFREVEQYLRDEGLPFKSFESDSHAGEHIIEVLNSFLDEATFAIMVVTADDETASGSIRARQNVVHEIGLFQGRLGFKNVAILKETDIEDFSNNAGLQHISFPKDEIHAAFHKLSLKLKSAGLIGKKS
jgi:predicted nucleotide-binding protein